MSMLCGYARFGNKPAALPSRTNLLEITDTIYSEESHKSQKIYKSQESHKTQQPTKTASFSGKVYTKLSSSATSLKNNVLDFFEKIKIFLTGDVDDLHEIIDLHKTNEYVDLDDDLEHIDDHLAGRVGVHHFKEEIYMNTHIKNQVPSIVAELREKASKLESFSKIAGKMCIEKADAPDMIQDGEIAAHMREQADKPSKIASKLLMKAEECKPGYDPVKWYDEAVQLLSEAEGQLHTDERLLEVLDLHQPFAENTRVRESHEYLDLAQP